MRRREWDEINTRANRNARAHRDTRAHRDARAHRDTRAHRETREHGDKRRRRSEKKDIQTRYTCTDRHKHMHTKWNVCAKYQTLTLMAAFGVTKYLVSFLLGRIPALVKRPEYSLLNLCGSQLSAPTVWTPNIPRLAAKEMVPHLIIRFTPIRPETNLTFKIRTLFQLHKRQYHKSPLSFLRVLGLILVDCS